jgi:hypothetical protein
LIVEQDGFEQIPLMEYGRMAQRTQKAFAYLRTSSAANVGPDKDSDRRQRDAIAAFAKRAGYELAGEFRDGAVSGRHGGARGCALCAASRHRGHGGRASQGRPAANARRSRLTLLRPARALPRCNRRQWRPNDHRGDGKPLRPRPDGCKRGASRSSRARD